MRFIALEISFLTAGEVISNKLATSSYSNSCIKRK